MNRLQFSGDDGTFTLAKPEEISYLYLPLASETGLKSAITPLLGGDSKLDQETFLLEPAGVQTLHTSRSTRNFWCVTEKGAWSAPSGGGTLYPGTGGQRSDGRVYVAGGAAHLEAAGTGGAGSFLCSTSGERGDHACSHHLYRLHGPESDGCRGHSDLRQERG